MIEKMNQILIGQSLILGRVDVHYTKPFLDEQSKEILLGTARADCQQVAEVLHDEKIEAHETQDDCYARQELKSKHDKEFKVKKAMAKTQETIKTAKLKIEHVKIEEHEMQETELNTKQNLLVEHDQLVEDLQWRNSTQWRTLKSR